MLLYNIHSPRLPFFSHCSLFSRGLALLHLGFRAGIRDSSFNESRVRHCDTEKRVKKEENDGEGKRREEGMGSNDFVFPGSP